MLRTGVFILALFLSNMAVNAFSFSSSPAGAREQEAQYLHNVKKEDAKEEFERKKKNLTPSGFMTMEEYEMLSAPKDKTQEEIPIPKPQKASDMKYVPQPDYELVRYNNPPGSPEISLGRDFKRRRQINAQGVVSPDYRILVYPSVYYYPKNAVVTCDLFVIPLEEKGNPLSKVKKANVMHRNPDPILSTTKSINDYGSFRTLTPIDFSTDGTKLLVKEKIGGRLDGIWQTNAIVYDFDTKTSYRLDEIRDAIIYYWKEYKNLNLRDYRWDIYPLGFDLNNPDRIVLSAYAYTGEAPVFLGNWSIDIKGTRSMLVSLSPNDVTISMNGIKMIKSGVVPPSILEIEEKQAKHEDELDEKAKKEEYEKKVKELETEYKNKIKEMEKEHKYLLEDYKIRDKVEGSTSTNDSLEKTEELLEQAKQKRIEKEAKAKAKQEAKEQKKLEKEQKKQKKLQEKLNKPDDSTNSTEQAPAADEQNNQ